MKKKDPKDNTKKVYRPRYPKVKSLTRCLIEGHYYKENIEKSAKLEKHYFYVFCTRCGDERIIHNKAEEEGNAL